MSNKFGALFHIRAVFYYRIASKHIGNALLDHLGFCLLLLSMALSFVLLFGSEGHCLLIFSLAEMRVGIEVEQEPFEGCFYILIGLRAQLSDTFRLHHM